MDVALADAQGDFKLYENQGAEGNWIQIDLAGDGERTVDGTRIVVETSEMSETAVRKSNADLQSQSTQVEHIGVGDAESVDIVAEFPDGSTHTFEDVDVNQRVVISSDGTISSD